MNKVESNQQEFYAGNIMSGQNQHDFYDSNDANVATLIKQERNATGNRNIEKLAQDLRNDDASPEELINIAMFVREQRHSDERNAMEKLINAANTSELYEKESKISLFMLRICLLFISAMILIVLQAGVVTSLGFGYFLGIVDEYFRKER